jgi:hypothetical protein
VEIVGYLIPTRGIASPLIKYDSRRLRERRKYRSDALYYFQKNCVSLYGTSVGVIESYFST